MSSNKMGFDFEKSLGAVTRTVSDLKKDGNPARNVTLERSYATTSDDLWDAVTSPERLERFFAPVRGELKLGGRFQIEGNADGKITECVPPKFFAATWEFAGELSWIEVRIAPEGDERSRLALSHICPVNDHWEKYGPGAVGVGWDLSLLGLAAHLSDKAFDRSEGQALMVSDEGKAFMVGASEDWGRAAVAAGENSVQAEAAAKRTTAFYTGEESQEG
jgi:uncharacterized protein YndB with AHSA1/START domain